MARGWESKSVEQQQADVLEKSEVRRQRPLSSIEQKLNRRQEGLLLVRKRLATQLRSASRPEHRHMLEQSLAELEQQLFALDGLSGSSTPK